MPTLDLSRLGAVEEERVVVDEGSREVFDRIAFAIRAVDLVRPQKMTVCVCEGKTKIKVESGRTWGQEPGEAWAVVSVPPTASRRAIALAVTRLGMGRESDPYTLDVLLSRAADPV